MFLNRIQWFGSLIKQRGIVGAFKKLKKELYSESRWIVLQLPLEGGSIILTPQSDDIFTAEILPGSRALFDDLTDIWPTSFPQMTQKSLLQQFNDRANNGVMGYYLQEDKLPIGALWYDAKESHLEGTPFSLQPHDRVIRNIFLSDKVQGRKLAIKLLADSIRFERDKQIQLIYALVFPSRKASINTFLALGFKEVGHVSTVTRLFSTKKIFKSS